MKKQKENRTPARRLYRILLWLCVFCIAGMVFYFSQQNGEVSHGSSSGVTEKILSIVVGSYDEMPARQQEELVAVFENPVRKLAHFSEFALLGLFIRLLLDDYRPRKHNSGWALILCAAYAASDELHQLITNARSAMVTDVLLDTFGAACGILAAYVLLLMGSRLILWFKKRKGDSSRC